MLPDRPGDPQSSDAGLSPLVGAHPQCADWGEDAGRDLGGSARTERRVALAARRREAGVRPEMLVSPAEQVSRDQSILSNATRPCRFTLMRPAARLRLPGVSDVELKRRRMLDLPEEAARRSQFGRGRPFTGEDVAPVLKSHRTVICAAVLTPRPIGYQNAFSTVVG